jgi:hypothetical protein
MAVRHRFVKAILRLPKPKRGINPFILRSFSRGEDVQTSLPCAFRHQHLVISSF